MIGIDNYVRLLRLMSAADLGDWSEFPVRRFLDSQEWWIPGDDAYRTAVETTPPWLGATLTSSNRRDGYTALAVRVADHADNGDLERCVRATETFFGEPAQLLGGYDSMSGGVFRQWRRPDHGPTGTTYSVEFLSGRIELALYPSREFEYEWSKNVDFGDGANDAPLSPLWLVTGPGPQENLGGMMFPGVRVVTNWADLVDSIRYSIRTLARDLRVLGDGMSIIFAPEGHGERYVRFLIDDEDGFLFAEAARGWGGPDDATMTALGWTTLNNYPDSDWASIHPDPLTDSRMIAERVAATLKAYGAVLPEFGGDESPGLLLCRTNFVSEGPFGGGLFTIYGMHVSEAGG
ncbi:TY-Chap domain-containing protein [Gordonia sp. NPDC003504]